MAERQLDDAHDVFFAHHEELVAFTLTVWPEYLPNRILSPTLTSIGTHLAVVVLLAVADGDDFALVGLFGGGVGDDDAAGGLTLFFEALDDHAVVQRTDFHAMAPIEKIDVLQ